MEKRITTMSHDPHAIGLADRACSLFIAPKLGNIFMDEGDGEGRINGVVFTPMNAPSFSVQPLTGEDYTLLLNYCGVRYAVGVSENSAELSRWADSANALLVRKRSGAVVENPTGLPSPDKRSFEAKPGKAMKVWDSKDIPAGSVRCLKENGESLPMAFRVEFDGEGDEGMATVQRYDVFRQGECFILKLTTPLDDEGNGIGPNGEKCDPQPAVITERLWVKMVRSCQ